jgi:hypothetical protein
VSIVPLYFVAVPFRLRIKLRANVFLPFDIPRSTSNLPPSTRSLALWYFRTIQDANTALFAYSESHSNRLFS